MQIFFLRSNPVKPDPRVEKEVLIALRNGYSVSVIGWDRSNYLPAFEETSFQGYKYSIYRLRLKANFGAGLTNLWKLVFFQFFILWKLLVNINKIDIIHAADFDTVLPAFLIKTLFRKKIVYDIYDFYVDAFPVPSFLKKTVRWIDYLMINKSDAVILTNESRLKQIEGASPRKLIVIHNTPFEVELEKKKETSIKSNSVNVAYVGVLQPSRLLLEIVNLFKAKDSWQLTVAGFGPLEDQIVKLIGTSRNIKFLGRVDYGEGIRISSSADILFATYDPSIENHKFSSPNKLYEAMMLSKPIIVCKGTGIDELVKYSMIGYAIDYDINQFEDIVDNFSKNKCDLVNMGQRARELYDKKFSSKIMEKRLVDLYRSI